MYGYVYKTTNLINLKVYIGQHKSKSFDPNYYGSGSWFSLVLKKYGRGNFKCEIIESCEDAFDLNEKEKYWIEHFQSRNPNVGYNLARGGEQFIVGCTEQEIKKISEQLLGATTEDIFDIVNDLQQYGLKIYEKNEAWQPTSNNSTGIKMIATDNSVIVSFYTKNQFSITKEYAETFYCSYWKYNLMVEIVKLPSLCKKLVIDYQSKRIVPENFKGPGRGTSGIFLETQKQTQSVRMPLIF